MISPLHCQWVITGLDYCITTSEGHGEWITGSVGHTGRGNIQSHRPGKYPINILTDPGSGILHMNYLLIDHLYQYQKLSSNKDKQNKTRDVTELRWISIFFFKSYHNILYSIIIYHIILYISLYYNSKQAPLISN